MKITLIGNTASSAVERLAEEAAQMDIDFAAVSLHSLILEVKDNTFSLTSREHGDVSDSDCYIFRGIGEADQETMVIAKYLLRHGATVIEENTASGALMMDKLFLHAIEECTPTPNYFLIQGSDALAAIAKKLTYPCVMKSTIGSMSRKVVLVEDEEELFAQYTELGNRVIIQEYFPVNFDVRAIVIDGAYVGAYKRTRDDDEFRMNKPGSTKEAIELPPEAIEICEHTARSQNIEIAGLDLVQYQNTWYVIEINTSPQFKRFEECTGVNVAKLILEYATKKVTNNPAAV